MGKISFTTKAGKQVTFTVKGGKKRRPDRGRVPEELKPYTKGLRTPRR